MSKYTLRCEYLIGNKVWGHACNTHTRVPQVTAWLGMVTHSLRCAFWHNIEYLCWGTWKQRNNLHQTNRSTSYSSYFRLKTKLSLERCSVFTCSIQVCWNRCHHTTTFSMSKMQSHVVLSVWFGRLFEYHSYNVFPKSMEFYICIHVFCFDLRTAAFSGQESCLRCNLLLHFCPSMNYKCKSEFLKNRYPQSSKLTLTCEMFLIIPLLLSHHSKKIGIQ